MKNLLLPFILLLLPGIFLNYQVTYAQHEKSDISQWVENNFAKNKIPPFSFVYGGKNSDTFIKSWQYKAEKKTTINPDVEESVYTYSDTQSGLVVKCFVTCFHDFQAVEWLLRFYNTSVRNTPLIEKAAVINHSFTSVTEGPFILHHARGSNAGKNDFQPLRTDLKIGENIYLTPSGGGRSSDYSAFPFFNIEMPDQKGIMVAVGWTGKWYADVSQISSKKVTLKSGMEKMQLGLYPKEEIRSPRICLLFWEGEDRMTGHNQFRQFILKHHSRKINGSFAEYPLSGHFMNSDPFPCGGFACLTEDYTITLVKRLQYFHILPEALWIDAGWYTGCTWNNEKGDWNENVGNWTADKERFPNGLRPVADAIHAAGAKFLVWFEPERARPGTQFDREHPEWLLRLPGKEEFLFNLGDDSARLWLTDYMTDFLEREGIDYYRQDFNLNPMKYWEANDKPGRKGISEIKHIQGLYAFWDSLLVRFPNLLIDNCSSGGRRIDLETTSRSAPLWRTDYTIGEPNGYQCHTYALNFYLPIHGTGIYRTDNYTFLSGLGAAAITGWGMTGKSESVPEMQKCLSDFKELRSYFYGDYYPLTESKNYLQDNIWLAYQLNRPGNKDGIVIAFRRGECLQESIRVKLRGLDKEAVYELFYDNYKINVRKTGSELMEGLDICITVKPGSLLIRYKKIE